MRHKKGAVILYSYTHLVAMVMICTHESTDLFVLKLIQLHKKKVKITMMIPT